MILVEQNKGMFVDSLIHWFDHHVTQRPDAVALVGVDRFSRRVVTSTWGELTCEVDRRASCIPRHGVVRTVADGSRDDVVTSLAIMRAGAMEVCVDGRLPAERIDELHQLSASRPAGDLVLFTSGTTSSPRGVVLTQENLFLNAMAKLAAVPQAVDDVRLCVLSIAHAYARTCDVGTWLLSGSTLAITLGSDGLLRMAPVVRPTLINVVPTIADRMLEIDTEAAGLDRLRLLGCGGAAMSVDSFGRWKERGVTVIQGYGLTETSPVICSATPENATPGCVGDFVDGWQHQIRDGQLFVRGPQVMAGYWGDDAATLARIDRDGWLQTGDLVTRDAATGQMRILGRVDDVIVLGNGRKISPAGIERQLDRVAGVRHSMLVAREGKLECWIDGDADEHGLRSVLDRFSECRGAVLRRFDPPLLLEQDELTFKGTIRRKRIFANRFSAASNDDRQSIAGD